MRFFAGHDLVRLQRFTLFASFISIHKYRRTFFGGYFASREVFALRLPALGYPCLEVETTNGFYLLPTSLLAANLYTRRQIWKSIISPGD